jgi:hypothetical protein
MNKLLSLGVASLVILSTGIAFAGMPFGTTITSGSTITAQRGAICGGSTDTYNVALPAGCSGTIDAGGNITVTNCTFAGSHELTGFVVTLSSTSGSGTFDGTNLALTPDINVNVTDDPPSGLSCDSSSPVSPPLMGTVDATGAGNISFSGSVSGPTFASSATCPATLAGTLNCLLQTVTGASLNITIP